MRRNRLKNALTTLAGWLTGAAFGEIAESLFGAIRATEAGTGFEFETARPWTAAPANGRIK